MVSHRAATNSIMKSIGNKIIKVGVYIAVCIVLLTASLTMFSCRSDSAQNTSVRLARSQNDLKIIELKTDLYLRYNGLPDLTIGDDVSMTTQQMIDYYGTNFIPSFIPKGLSRTKDDFCIYKLNGGTGKVYWDWNDISWTDTGNNSTYNKSIEVTVSKETQFSLFADPPDKLASKPLSKINGVNVIIAHYTDGNASKYYSSFFYKGVGFMINSQNISHDDFVKIVSSVLK